MIFKPPLHAPDSGNLKLFLAGSIDMGKAIDWQKQIETALSGLVIDIYNPRRDDWDSSWKQAISHPGFREQVEWELAHLERADMIVFYFDPKGASPVSMLELGLHARSGKVIVCCPEGFWRRGNIEITCLKYGVPFFSSLEQAIEHIRKRGNKS